MKKTGLYLMIMLSLISLFVLGIEIPMAAQEQPKEAIQPAPTTHGESSHKSGKTEPIDSSTVIPKGPQWLGAPIMLDGTTVKQESGRISTEYNLPYDKVLTWYREALKRYPDTRYRDWKEEMYIEDQGVSKWHSIKISKTAGPKTLITIQKDNWTWIMLYSAAMSLPFSPLNVYEKISCNKEIKNTVIEKSPIFIIGHWRSGTTYLHNLLSQNGTFAYPTTFQTITPGLFLCFENIVKPIVAASLPPKRPEDDIALGADLPQEEEYGIGNLSPYSFYNGWCFPRNLHSYYNYVLMENVSKQTIKFLKQKLLYNKLR